MRTQRTKKGWPSLCRGRRRPKAGTPGLSVLEPAHVGGPFGLGSGDLGGITDDEGSILAEHPQERLFKGGLLQEAVDHLVASEERLGDGPGDFGNPW